MTTTEFWTRIAIGAAIAIAGILVGGTLGLIILLTGLAVIAHDVIDAQRQVRKARKIAANRR